MLTALSIFHSVLFYIPALCLMPWWLWSCYTIHRFRCTKFPGEYHPVCFQQQHPLHLLNKDTENPAPVYFHSVPTLRKVESNQAKNNELYIDIILTWLDVINLNAATNPPTSQAQMSKDHASCEWDDTESQSSSYCLSLWPQNLDPVMHIHVYGSFSAMICMPRPASYNICGLPTIQIHTQAWKMLSTARL